MEKKVLLAIILSFLVITLYPRLLLKLYPNAQQGLKSNYPQVSTGITQEAPPPTAPQKPISENLINQEWRLDNIPTQELKLSNKDLEVDIKFPGGIINKVFLKRHNAFINSYLFAKPKSISNIDEKVITQHEVKAIGEDKVEWRETINGMEMVKLVQLRDNYSLAINIKYDSNYEKSTTYDDLEIIFGNEFPISKNDARLFELDLASADKVMRLNLADLKKTTFSQDIAWLGFRDKYFTSILKPLDNNKLDAEILKISDRNTGFRFVIPKETLLSENGFWFLLYTGPQETNILQKVDPDFSRLVNYGFFDNIAKFILLILNKLYTLTKNWGLAITFLSILIYLLLFPLTLKQMVSIKKMQEIQPEINKLRVIYKDNPQKLNRELLEIYKKNRINPLGGCLPLVLQMPVFFALYQALNRTIDLKGARFLWIKDLSEPDRLFNKPFEINILPIIMIIIMVLQQRLTPQATTPETESQQKIMMILFPLMFGIFFYQMPSGLVLYWTVNSALMFLNQKLALQTKV